MWQRMCRHLSKLCIRCGYSEVQIMISIKSMRKISCIAVIQFLYDVCLLLNRLMTICDSISVTWHVNGNDCDHYSCINLIKSLYPYYLYSKNPLQAADCTAPRLRQAPYRRASSVNESKIASEFSQPSDVEDLPVQSEKPKPNFDDKCAAAGIASTARQRVK